MSEKLAREFDLPEHLVRKIIKGALTEIESMAMETGRCQIRGFGTFKLRTFAQRKMHDYASRQIITLPERKKLVFEHGRDRQAIVQEVKSGS